MTDESNEQSAFLSRPPSPVRSDRVPPIEAVLIFGVALGLSGHWLLIPVSAIAYAFLSRIRPTAPPGITVVASVRLAGAAFALLAIGLDLSTPVAAIEPVIVTALTVILLYTKSRLLALALIIHAVAVIVTRGYSSAGNEFTVDEQRMIVGGIALNGVVVWLLYRFLRLQPANS
jgi:hypothetical protein